MVAGSMRLAIPRSFSPIPLRHASVRTGEYFSRGCHQADGFVLVHCCRFLALMSATIREFHRLAARFVPHLFLRRAQYKAPPRHLRKHRKQRSAAEMTFEEVAGSGQSSLTTEGLTR
jgi:hypothetical protein